MSQLSATLSYFFEDLKKAGWDDKVVAMTISEFGRRVKENGSSGTDHGTAAPLLLFGKSLEGNGFIGQHPSLNNLDTTGNMFPTTDFRQVYASLMKNWLCIDEQVVNNVLLGEDYLELNLGFNCTNTNTSKISEQDNFKHTVTYNQQQSYLHINTTRSTHVDISIYNMAGQKVTTLKNEVLIEGKHVFNISEACSDKLPEGIYAYMIKTNTQNYSKSVMIF